MKGCCWMQVSDLEPEVREEAEIAELSGLG